MQKTEKGQIKFEKRVMKHMPSKKSESRYYWTKEGVRRNDGR